MNLLEVDFKDREGNWVLRYREPVKFGGRFVQTRLGRLHNNITQRCNRDGKLQNKHMPSYKGVTISKNFKNPQKFCDWAVSQVGWGLGYHLDKDLLKSGNRVYGEDYCVFLPPEINFNIKRKYYNNGKLYGAFLDKKSGKFFSSISSENERYYLGIYNTEEEASRVFCKFKEGFVRDLADSFRDTIDPRAYAALMVWQAVPDIECLLAA